MALSQADVDALESAIASGELRVSYDGRDVTFRSVAEIKEALAYVKGAIAEASATPPARVTYASFCRD